MRARVRPPPSRPESRPGLRRSYTRAPGKAARPCYTTTSDTHVGSHTQARLPGPRHSSEPHAEVMPRHQALTPGSLALRRRTASDQGWNTRSCPRSKLKGEVLTAGPPGKSPWASCIDL